MGWFGSSKRDPEFQNAGYLANIPIDRWGFYGSYRRPDVRTILHRMGHLVYHTSGAVPIMYESAMIAKWLLQKLPSIRLSSEDRALTDNFARQLRQNIASYERRYGRIVDANQFDLLVRMAGETTERIICAGPLFATIEPEWGTPGGDLSKTISWYGWRQSMVENSRI